MTHPVDDPVLQQRFVQEFGTFLSKRETVAMVLTPVEAWAVLGMLQLASRPPGSPEHIRRAAEQVARRIQAAIAPPGSALAEVAELGWHAEHDR